MDPPYQIDENLLQNEKIGDDENGHETTKASHTEYILWHYIAPALLSPRGKAFVLLVFGVWSFFSAYAWT